MKKYITVFKSPEFEYLLKSVFIMLNCTISQISCLAVYQIRLTALLKGLSAVHIHLDFLHPAASINKKVRHIMNKLLKMMCLTQLGEIG